MHTKLPSEGASEAVLEEFFFKRVRLLGGLCYKIAPTEIGLPDRLVILPRQRMYLVELKKIGGQLSPKQRHLHTTVYERTGIKVHVLYGVSGILDWFRDSVKGDPQNARRSPDE